MQPAPAIPPFEPPPLPSTMGDSGRRILWIVGLYRAICAATLLGAALLLDAKTLSIANPNAFVTGTGLYFVFGTYFQGYGTDIYRIDTTGNVTLTHQPFHDVLALTFLPGDPSWMYLGITNEQIGGL